MRKDIAKNSRLVMEEMGITSSVVDPMKCIVRVGKCCPVGGKNNTSCV